jgi:hypothetical protein
MRPEPGFPRYFPVSRTRPESIKDRTERVRVERSSPSEPAAAILLTPRFSLMCCMIRDTFT